MTHDGPSSHLDLEVLAATLRGHSDDLSLYAGFLLNVLSAALPAELIEVQREGKWRARLAGREPVVLSVSVLVGDNRYQLARDEIGRPASARQSESRDVSELAVGFSTLGGGVEPPLPDLLVVAGEQDLRHLPAPVDRRPRVVRILGSAVQSG